MCVNKSNTWQDSRPVSTSLDWFFLVFSTNIATGNQKISEFVQLQPVVWSFAVGFSLVSVFFSVQRTGPVNTTFSKEKKKIELYFYVKVSLTSLDSTWTSCSVKAIITPGLCATIIFGLPWLEDNNIVTDHSAYTWIDKKNDYDLLNLPVMLPPTLPKLKIHEQIKSMKADKKLVLAELMMVCNDGIKHLKLKPDEVKEFNVAGAIVNNVDVLFTWSVRIS